MSGNIQKIPVTSISTMPIGQTKLKFHQGNSRLTEFVASWKEKALIPRLRSIDSQWNKNIYGLLGDLDNLYNKYDINKDNYFDASKLFVDSETWNDFFNRPMLISEYIFDLYRTKITLTDAYDILLNQVSKINNFTPPSNFLGLNDTPSSYTGQAGKYLGVDSNGTNLDFIFPRSQATLLSLSDGPGAYPSAPGLVTSGSTSLNITTLDDAQKWRMESITYSGLIDTFSFSGTACDNVLYSIDLGDMASNTAFQITLGTSYHGARVCFKVKSGQNLNTNKYIEADTGGGVSLMDAQAPDKYQIEPPFALTLVYSTASASYYITEKFEAF